MLVWRRHLAEPRTHAQVADPHSTQPHTRTRVNAKPRSTMASRKVRPLIRSTRPDKELVGKNHRGKSPVRQFAYGTHWPSLGLWNRQLLDCPGYVLSTSYSLTENVGIRKQGTLGELACDSQGCWHFSLTPWLKRRWISGMHLPQIRLAFEAAMLCMASSWIVDQFASLIPQD